MKCLYLRLISCVAVWVLVPTWNGGNLHAAMPIKVSGAVRTAEVVVPHSASGSQVRGKLILPEAGGLAWSNHYHVNVIGHDGTLLLETVYRHGLKAPKAQSGQRSKSYHLDLQQVNPAEIAGIHFERVKQAHGFCE